MKLLTSTIIKALPALYATDGVPLSDKLVICKFFCPDSDWTWYVFEGEKLQAGDYQFFGMVHGHEMESGYFLLSELTTVRGPMGLPVERDRSVFKVPYAELVSTAKQQGHEEIADIATTYPEHFIDWMRESFDQSLLSDIARHGANVGWPGLTYYSETVALYERYHEDIWTMLEEDRDNAGYASCAELIASFNGAKHADDDVRFKNLLVWYAAERVAFELSEEQAEAESE